MEWNGTAWVQKGIDLDGEAADDESGFSVSMPDANTVAIGAHRNDASGTDAGQVRVYEWDGTTWIQKGIDVDGETVADLSGRSVSMPDASTLAIGAINNDGSGSNAGHVRIYSMCNTISVINATTCSSYTSPSGNYTWTSSGAYTDIIPNTAGCDSVITVNLTVNTVDVSVTNSSSNLTANAIGATYAWLDCNNAMATISGAVNQSFSPTANGNYAVEVTQNGCLDTSACEVAICNTTNIINLTTCSSYTSPSGNFIWTSSGVYTDIIPNIAGCDSVVTVNLTVNNETAGTDIQTACEYYLWIDGNTYTASNDIATHTLTNIAGCDSVVTLNLTINNISDLTTTLTDITVAANNSAASYIWLDCDNNFAPISGETAQSFTPTANGNYAVALLENGCMDTSICVAVTTVGIIENSFTENFVLFPNPTNGEVKIVFENNQEELNVSLLSITGQLLESKTFKNSATITFEIEGAPGVYLLKLKNSNNEEATIRVVKE